MGIEIAVRELATAGIDRYSYFADALDPAKVIRAMLEAHAAMIPDPDLRTTTIKYALICLGCTAVAVGLPLVILRKIRHDASRSEPIEKAETQNNNSPKKIKTMRPVDEFSPRKPELRSLPEHPEVEKFVGQGQVLYQDLELLNIVSGSPSEIIDGTCRDTDS